MFTRSTCYDTFLFLAYSAVAVNKTSDDELSAVSQESWITPMTKPIATTCIATSSEIPSKLHANGISNNDPPATPDAPAAETADKTIKITAVNKSTFTPNVCAAAIDKTEIVTAAPAILIVAPKGIETAYVSLFTFNFSAKFIFTGIFAAELLVKNAVTPLSFNTVKTSGYGFFRVAIKTIIGFITNAINNIVPTKIIIKRPYSPKAAKPVVDTVSNTIPKIPIGAKLITH